MTARERAYFGARSKNTSQRYPMICAEFVERLERDTVKAVDATRLIKGCMACPVSSDPSHFTQSLFERRSKSDGAVLCTMAAS